ncbi:MAG TPA: hypothetical protein PLD74_03005, partial [Prolixibacteraceae bacterium]|nr:hypothetical protein [Prolixibacteraceae bacterium]HQH75667.1 hypothetical protein [Prolixibacteraceae bacterium]HQJ85252.1 hypothetical protein [Prolixibacteraceae bacterium]
MTDRLICVPRNEFRRFSGLMFQKNPYFHRNDNFLLLSLKEPIDKIFRYCSGYTSAEELYQNDRDFDATMMNFIVIGEISGKLSKEFKAANSNSVSPS